MVTRSLGIPALLSSAPWGAACILVLTSSCCNVWHHGSTSHAGERERCAEQEIQVGLPRDFLRSHFCLRYYLSPGSHHLLLALPPAGKDKAEFWTLQCSIPNSCNVTVLCWCYQLTPTWQFSPPLKSPNAFGFQDFSWSCFCQSLTVSPIPQGLQNSPFISLSLKIEPGFVSLDSLPHQWCALFQCDIKWWCCVGTRGAEKSWWFPRHFHTWFLQSSLKPSYWTKFCSAFHKLIPMSFS